MQKTLTCTCGGNMSYNTDKADDAEFIDGVFYATHSGEGHEITEKDTYICDEEEW
jgi:hypothetical protein